MKFPQNLQLYLVSLIVNIHSFSAGSAYSWSSPVLPILNSGSEWNPLPKPLTLTEAAIITSILNIGAALGAGISGCVAQKIGRKKTLLLSAVPSMIAHLMSAFAGSVTEFYISRILFGLSAGTAYSILPMYMGEIAEDSNRGTLGCYMTMFSTFGVLFGFVWGPFVSIKVLGFMYLAPEVIFFVLCLVLVPESPYYLLTQKDTKGAEESLAKLRGKGNVKKELAHMQAAIDSEEKIPSIGSMLRVRSVRRAFVISMGLYFLQQLAGICAILNYMQIIFEAAGSTISPAISPIIVTVVQCFAMFLSMYLVDKSGRKILLLISTSGCAVSMLILGLYFYFKVNAYDVSSVTWIPLTSLVMYMIVHSLGLGPITPCIMGEIFPSNCKAVAGGFSTGFCLSNTFLVSMFFPYLSNFLGMAESLWVFSVISFFGCIFVFFVVPETKGKSFKEIQTLLNGTTKKKYPSDSTVSIS